MLTVKGMMHYDHPGLCVVQSLFTLNLVLLVANLGHGCYNYHIYGNVLLA